MEVNVRKGNFILYFFYSDGFPEGPGEEVSAPAVEAEQTPTWSQPAGLSLSRGLLCNTRSDITDFNNYYVLN